MRLRLRGKDYDLTREDVEKKMHDVNPEPIRLYYCVINGKKYPPKQILGESLGLGKVEFTTMDASNILKRLGFSLERL